MQQTEQYKLNLIETSDPFSPNPLNENAQKLEGAIEAARTEAKAGDAALDGRLKVIEARRLVYGAYQGTGSSSSTVSLGFTPKVVIADASNNSKTVVAVNIPDSPYTSQAIITGGFRPSFLATYFNDLNAVYHYVAIG